VEGSRKARIQLHEVEDVVNAFSEIQFSKTMFTDHSPHHYNGSLELLRAALSNTPTTPTSL
jgi:hypothetical protein